MLDAVSIGKFVATFGVQGELILKHGLGKKSDLNTVKFLLIEDKAGAKIPYFITSAKAKTNEETFVMLEGVSTKEQAQTLTRKAVWLAEADFNQQVSPSSTIALIGFLMVENKKPLGPIVEVIEQPHQILCTILTGGKEALIPLHEQSLLSIDRKKKEVHVTLPEGLLDVYLS